MADPYITSLAEMARRRNPSNPMAAFLDLNQGLGAPPPGGSLGEPLTFGQRVDWVHPGDVMRSFLAGSLAGAPYPPRMLQTGAAAGLDTFREQMYGRDPAMAGVMLAGDPKKAAGMALARVARQAPVRPVEPGVPIGYRPAQPGGIDFSGILDRVLAQTPADRNANLLESAIAEHARPPAAPQLTGDPVADSNLLSDIIAAQPRASTVLTRTPGAPAPTVATVVVPKRPAADASARAKAKYKAAKAAAQEAAEVTPGAAYIKDLLAGKIPDTAVMPDPQAAGQEPSTFMRPLMDITPREVRGTTAGNLNKDLDISYTDWEAMNKEQGLTPWEGLFDMTKKGAAPTPQVQITRSIPKKGASKRLQAAMDDPAVKQQLIEWVKAGGEQVPESWYHTNPLYQSMVEELGPEDGPDAFKKMMDMVAATSPRSSIPNNIRTASHYYNQVMEGVLPQDLEMGGKGSGYGSIAQNLHLQNAKNFAANQVDPFQNPKPISFSGNLQGNELPVTVDTHNWRAIGMAAKNPDFLATTATKMVDKVNKKGETVQVEKEINPRQLFKEGKLTMEEALNEPTYWDSTPSSKTEYGPAEKWQQEIAAELGISPSDLQGKMWVGAGPKTGLGSPPENFMTTLAKRIAYTAHRLGRKPKDVLKLFLRGKIPLAQARPLELPTFGGTSSGGTVEA